ncbi:MAG: cell division protein SepF [Coriobacteriales bacterium]|jgi:cell division inhibitor SepF|nr:cell division protein SepF [Coriobacteriales bacterium]
MGFLDDMKNRISGLGKGAKDEYDNAEYNGYEEYDEDELNGRQSLDGRYDSSSDYNDDYDLGYEDDFEDSRAPLPSNASLGAARQSYQIDDHVPLVTLSDVRSAGVAELQSAARAMQRNGTGSIRTVREPYATSETGSMRTVREPYATSETQLRGDTPEYYASRSGQVKARSTTGNLAKHPFRQLVVVRPNSYGEAEKISLALKENHAVAVDLRSTRPELGKRILDFTFGAASALGAQVDTPANRVYAITIGHALTDEEHELLVARGII